MEDGEYVKTPINTVNRHGKDYAKYDADLIHHIVNTTSVLHVSFVPDPSTAEPVILPMIGQIGSFDAASPPAIYLHGYVSSRLMRLGSSSSGIPVCVCATKLDGLVLSLTPFAHSYNYRSAILHGRATILGDGEAGEAERAEKLWAMELVTNSVVPQRWQHSRVPPDNAEVQATRILKVVVESASAKVRDFGTKDERKDLKREDVMEKVWAGVVPVQEILGEPVASTYNKVEKVPGYLRDFVDGRNTETREYALKAASTEAPGRKKREE